MIEPRKAGYPAFKMKKWITEVFFEHKASEEVTLQNISQSLTDLRLAVLKTAVREGLSKELI